MNVVVLSGTLSRAPESRTLPSGDRLGLFEVTIRDAQRATESVPVVWFGVPDGILALEPGLAVVVTGRVRRRFFRTPAGTASRTEVVAHRLVPASQRKRVQALVDGAVEQLGAAGVA